MPAAGRRRLDAIGRPDVYAIIGYQSAFRQQRGKRHADRLRPSYRHRSRAPAASSSSWSEALPARRAQSASRAIGIGAVRFWSAKAERGARLSRVKAPGAFRIGENDAGWLRTRDQAASSVSANVSTAISAKYRQSGAAS